MEDFLTKVKNLEFLSGKDLELKVFELLTMCQVKFVYQPNGSQAFPDFYLEEHSLNLECKSSAGTKPMWNCTYPKKGSLYIFSSKKLSKTLVIRGEDIITDEIVEIYEEYSLAHKHLQLYINSKLNSVKNRYGMRVFARNMFVQNTGFVCAEGEDGLSIETSNYECKDELAQYFTTSKKIQEKLLNDYTKTPRKVLEPSCGLGHLLSILPLFNCEIIAMDIDKDVVDISKKLFPDASFLCDDFLKYDFKDKLFDLIIGNPPYFEVSRASVSTDFSEIFNGRINIYYLFIYKCLKLLEIGGELRVVIPKSFLSNVYAKKLRNYLVSKCEIIGIEYFGNNEFDNAIQDTVILKCLRVETPEKSKHEIVINDTLFFVKDSEEIILSGITLKSLGLTVKTGNVVWNQCKGLLRKTPGVKLWYASDISGKTEANKEKMRFMEYSDSIESTRGPCILVQRIVSKKIIYKLVEDGEFYVENHINVISGNLEVLRAVCASFDNDLTSNFVRDVFSSTQISKTELESVLQIYN